MTVVEIQTRDRIMQVAFQLFLTQGYENTPVQAIIDAVGIAKGTFYHHFPSKEAMLVELVDSISRAALDNASAVMRRSDLDTMAKMTIIFRASLAIKMEKVDESLVLARQMLGEGNQMFTNRIMKAGIQKVLPLLTQLIQEGVADGSFTITHPDETAKILMSVLQGGGFEETLNLWIAALEGNASAVAGIRRQLEANETAINRLLGLPDGSMQLYDIETVIAQIKNWATAHVHN